MIATPEDVLVGFQSLWTTAGIPVVVSGGLHDARAIPATAEPPMAVLAVMPGEKETMTGGLYTEKFKVTTWTHTVQNQTDRVALGRLFARIDYSEPRWPPGRGECLHVRPLPTPTDASPFGNQARDIAVIPAAWEVLMQQTR